MMASILRPAVLDWLREGLDNPAGLLRVSDAAGQPWVSDAELGEALWLGLAQRYQPLGLGGFEGFALTPRGREYLARLAARATAPGQDPRVCKDNPFEAAAREAGA